MKKYLLVSKGWGKPRTVAIFESPDAAEVARTRRQEEVDDLFRRGRITYDVPTFVVKEVDT